MSILDEESSSSLIIAEAKNELLINSSLEQSKKDDDLFELSKDEISLSFQIDEEKPPGLFQLISKQSKEDTLILDLQEPEPEETKKKRKEIFQKFKRPEHKVQKNTADDNLLNIFDSIFKTKPIEPSKICGEVDCRDNGNLLRPILEGSSVRSRTPSAQRQRVKIFNKKNTAGNFEAILPADILQSSLDSKQQTIKIQQKIELEQSPINQKKQVDIQSISKRISWIESKDHLQFSRDSIDINTILQSEIFQQEVKEKQENQLRTMEKQPQPNAKWQQGVPTTITLAQSIVEDNNINVNKLVMQVNSPRINDYQEPSRPFSGRNTNNNEKRSENEENKEANNDLSMISATSTATIPVMNYQGQNSELTPENSTINYRKRIEFGEVSQVRPFVIDKSDDKIVQNKATQQLIKKEKVQMNHIFEAESRLPPFLRKLRHQMSVYPNFYFTASPVTSEMVRDEFDRLFDECSVAVSIISQLCEKVLEAKSIKQLYMQELANNMTLQFFMESDWKNIGRIDTDYHLITPVEPIVVRAWNYEKIRTAVANYENIVAYYRNKGVVLDLQTDKGLRKYFQIRQKFWDICGNMKLISEDVYCEIINLKFPNHYYDFHSFMKSKSANCVGEKQLRDARKMLNCWHYLKEEKDLLVNSEIGREIRAKLQLQLRYQAPC